MLADPRSTYTRSLAERRAEITAREARHRKLGHAKIAVAAAGVALVWLALSQGGASILWVLAPIAAFIALVVIHEKLLADLERRRRAAPVLRKRASRALMAIGPAPENPANATTIPRTPTRSTSTFSAKAASSNCSAPLVPASGRTASPSGSNLLLAIDSVTARQQAVSELRDRLDLREELAIVAEEARSGVDPAALAHWGEAAGPPVAPAASVSRSASSPSSVSPAFVALWVHLLRSASVIILAPQVDSLLLDFFLVALLINGWFLYRHNGEMGAAVSAVEEAAHELGLLSEVLVRMEREHFPARCSPVCAPRSTSKANLRHAAWPPQAPGGVPRFARQRRSSAFSSPSCCGPRTWP